MPSLTPALLDDPDALKAAAEGDAIAAVSAVVKPGLSKPLYVARELLEIAQPAEELLQQKAARAIEKQSGMHSLVMSFWIAALADRGLALPADREAAWIAKVANAAGALQGYERVLVESYLLSRPAEDRARLYLSAGRQRMTLSRVVVDRATAEVAVDRFAATTEASLKDHLKMLRPDAVGTLVQAAAHVPAAVAAQLAKPPSKLHEQAILLALGKTESEEAIAPLLKKIDKPAYFAAAREGLPDNGVLRAALETLAAGKANKAQLAAAELLALLASREPEVVALTRRTVDDTLAAAMRRKVDRGVLGHFSADAPLRGLADLVAEYTEAEVWHALAGEIAWRVRIGSAMSFGAWPGDVGKMLLMREDPEIRSAGARMIVEVAIAFPQVAHEEVVPLLADRLRFRPWHSDRRAFQQSRPTDAALLPLWLEALRYPRAAIAQPVADMLLSYPDATVAALPAYLGRREYAQQAAAVAERLASPALVAPLQEALDAKPAKKLRVALEAAHLACEAASLLA